MPAETTTVTRTAPLALWRIAEAFLHTLCALFGAPDEIAQRHTFVHKHYALMLSWLRAGEAMMRRLLAIEAAAYAKPATCPLPRPAQQRARRAVEFRPDKPDDWRVSFRCFLERRRPRRRGAGERRREQRFHDAWPAALRLEALIRAFNDPQPYARRIACRLHANVARLAELLFAPPEFEHRVDRCEEFTSAARDAWRQPDSS